MSREINIGERVDAVVQTIKSNRDVWIDLALVAVAGALAYWVAPEGNNHLLRTAGAFAILTGPAALLARPIWASNCNQDRRIWMGSDDFSLDSDERFLCGYLWDAWKTGQVQFPNSRLRHTEGFYLGDDPK